MSRLLVLLIAAIAICSQAYAAKPYSPFDEPKPRIPREITEDERLDVKVNVFVKSKNVRDLFAEITKQTGVKLTASRNIAAERAIIYFHARPLRDVMTEISGLFGYYWLPKGKEGEFTYELREDSRHAEKRRQIDKQRAGELRDLFAKFTDEVIEDPSVLDRLLEAEAKSTGEPPMTLAYKEVPDLFSALGTERISDWVSGGGSGQLRWEELSPDTKEGLLRWVNTFSEYRRELATGVADPGKAREHDLQDLSQRRMQYISMSGSSTSMPHFRLSIWRTDGRGAIAWLSWPPSLDEDDLRKAMGAFPRNALQAGKPLPDKCKVTVDKHRLSDYKTPYVLVGDVLEAIHEYAGLDVIGDYYFQDYGFTEPFQKRDLTSILSLLWGLGKYACSFDGSVLRLRYYPWFAQEPMREPAASLIEKCWDELAQKKKLSKGTVTEIVWLPDDQVQWKGFQFIPCADQVSRGFQDLRLWADLGPEVISRAEEPSGLPAADLSPLQMDRLITWVNSNLPKLEPEAIAKGTLRIGSAADSGPTARRVELALPDCSAAFEMHLEPSFDEKKVDQIVAQRKADAEADKVELAQ